MAESNIFAHSDCKWKNLSIGENIAYSINYILDGRQVTDYWYQEINDHDFNSDYQNSSGHFSQLIWKSTESVGFGYAVKQIQKEIHFYAVANYYPAGNIISQYVKNVLPAKR